MHLSAIKGSWEYNENDPGNPARGPAVTAIDGVPWMPDTSRRSTSPCAITWLLLIQLFFNYTQSMRLLILICIKGRAYTLISIILIFILNILLIKLITNLPLSLPILLWSNGLDSRLSYTHDHVRNCRHQYWSSNEYIIRDNYNSLTLAELPPKN